MKNEEVKNFYDKVIASNYSGSYEYKRWFSSSQRLSGYKSTKETLLKIFKKYQLSYNNYLELGPGPGTWSSLFFELNNKASMDLVDISKEMLKMAKERFEGIQSVSCIQSDFLVFDTEKRYELFFSSRALEYFDNKEALVDKVYNLLTSGGVGIIVTKTPHYKRKFLNKLSSLHQGQIAPSDLENILVKKGFRVLGIYGTTYVFPILGIGLLDRFLYKLFSKFNFGWFSRLFSESYTTIFKKI